MSPDAVTLISALSGGVSAVFTAVAVVVTVALWTKDRARSREAAREQERHLVVQRALDLADRTARAASLRPVSKLWFSPDLEFALLVPRLYLAVDPRDRDVAVWVAREAQQLTLAVRGKTIAKMAVIVATQLGAWEQGLIATRWFTDQLARQPFDPKPLPKSRLILRDLGWFGQWALTWGLGALLALAGSDVVKQVVGLNVEVRAAAPELFRALRRRSRRFGQ